MYVYLWHHAAQIFLFIDDNKKGINTLTPSAPHESLANSVGLVKGGSS